MKKTGKNKITNPKVKEKVMTFLKERTVDLEDHQPKEWTSEDRFKVTQILDIISGNETSFAKKEAENSSNDNVSTKESKSSKINDEAFGDDDDDANNFFDIDSSEE
jgi:protein-tyrosine-phosphatase